MFPHFVKLQPGIEVDLIGIRCHESAQNNLQCCMWREEKRYYLQSYSQKKVMVKVMENA